LQVLIIGNTENRRVRFFVDELDKKQLSYRVVAWKSFLDTPTIFDDLLQSPCFVKIESFGENFDVFKSLLIWGENAIQGSGFKQIKSKDIALLKPDMGRIHYSRQAYLGFEKALRYIEGKASDQVSFLNSPQAILQMFDKSVSHELLGKAGIPKTRYYGHVTSYEALQSLILHNKSKQLFIKLAHGSSASGVMAYRRSSSRESLVTSVELVREGDEVKLYNSLRIRTYRQTDDIKCIIDHLAKENLLVERWEPKASFENGTFDLRLVVINGKAEHAVMRCSRSPMTNLHLGNRRGDLQALKDKLGDDFWHRIEKLAIDTVQQFSGAAVAGVDILITSGCREAKVIEVNAFGDLIPNIVNIAGRSTYAEEVELINTRLNVEAV